MVSILINNIVSEVRLGSSVLEACRIAGVKIPRFCYHETLSIAGNCRMCLVEIEGLEKAVASCLTEVSEGMIVFTESVFAKKAREGVLEELLLNHPLDCPICDQAGECDLQDQARRYGTGNSKFYVKKRGVEDKYCGPLIKTIMTRCIHCTRCVRFGSEIAGLDFLGTFKRGGSTEIGSYIPKFFNSEISGNVVDLCPVGALTAKPYTFKGRPWEMRISDSVDLTDSLGSGIYVNFKGRQLFRVLPKSSDNTNDQIITDKARFSYDGNHKNRITEVSLKKNISVDRKKIKWMKILKSKKIKAFLSQNVTFVVNCDTSFDSLYSLSTSVFIKKNITVNCLKSDSKSNNLYLWGLVDKISDIHSCSGIGLIYSINPKIECALLNTKLRIRLQNSLLSLFSLTCYFNSDINIRFSNLSLVKSISLFEGRYFDLSKSYLASVSPLFLTSNFFIKRGISLVSLFSFLKAIFKSIKIVKTNESINVESLDFFNIKKITKKSMLSSKKLVLIDVEDVFLLRKSLSSVKKIFLSLNSHSNGLIPHTRISLPSLSYFEDERVLLNMEQRPIKTSKAYSSFYDARSIKNTLTALLNLSKKAGKKHVSFMYKMLNNPVLFDINYKYFIILGSSSENLNKNFKLMKYPTKANLMDFYRSSKLTKSSSNMIASSVALRSYLSNFA